MMMIYRLRTVHLLYAWLINQAHKHPVVNRLVGVNALARHFENEIKNVATHH